MSTTDPAVEAAQRAWDATGGFGFNCASDALEEAAREALAPIRALHQQFASYITEANCPLDHVTFEDEDGEWACVTCTNIDGGPRKTCTECRDEDGKRSDWPCATAELAYPSEEL